MNVIKVGDEITMQGFSGTVTDILPAGEGQFGCPWDRAVVRFDGHGQSETLPLSSLELSQDAGRIAEVRFKFCNEFAELVSETIQAGVLPQNVAADIHGTLSVNVDFGDVEL